MLYFNDAQLIQDTMPLQYLAEAKVDLPHPLAVGCARIQNVYHSLCSHECFVCARAEFSIFLASIGHFHPALKLHTNTCG